VAQRLRQVLLQGLQGQDLHLKISCLTLVVVVVVVQLTLRVVVLVRAGTEHLVVEVAGAGA
jgi:hypothetical protein